MTYKLCDQVGDCVAVPQLVFAQLDRTDGDTIRVALYLLRGGASDPRAIAHDLGLKSVAAAERALLFWAGAGLLERENGTPALAAPKELSPEEVLRLAMTDPLVSTLVQEAQANLGRALSRKEMDKLINLYLVEHYPVDVILLCAAFLSSGGKHTVAAVERELRRWRDGGVETGEDAEKYLRREEQRAAFIAKTAELFDVRPADLTQLEKRTIVRWKEDWGFGAELIREALLRADSHRTVRYVDGILRSWHTKGWMAVSDVRGGGSLQGSNILATGAVSRPAASAANDPFQQDWSSLFDNGSEG